MSADKSGNKTHDDAIAKSEGARQVAISAAAPVQLTVKNADVTHYRAVLASALANGVNPCAAMQALRDLGTGGA